MDNTFDDFDGAIDDINVERKKNKFELVQLKLEHYYFNSGDIDAGMPLSTSIELSCNYNFEKAKLEWTKIVSHTYLSLNNPHENVTDTYTEEVSNIEQLIREIEKYDLRDLKNNIKYNSKTQKKYKSNYTNQREYSEEFLNSLYAN